VVKRLSVLVVQRNQINSASTSLGVSHAEYEMRTSRAFSRCALSSSAAQIAAALILVSLVLRYQALNFRSSPVFSLGCKNTLVAMM